MASGARVGNVLLRVRRDTLTSVLLAGSVSEDLRLYFFPRCHFCTERSIHLI
uniref:Uncharacterized protein n=1 Tax=Anguilla anguilla TaxID=7936 RepID=A0A0E9QFT6_ANGAN